jgi:hypothetical protein
MASPWPLTAIHDPDPSVGAGLTGSGDDAGRAAAPLQAVKSDRARREKKARIVFHLPCVRQ